MKPEKVEKGSLSRAFRKAVVTGLAAAALLFGTANTAQAQTDDEDDIYTTSKTVKKTADSKKTAAYSPDTTKLEPWQKDSSYTREMDLALKAYQSKVKAINDQLETDTLRVKRERYISSSGHMDLMRILTSGSQVKAAVSQYKASAAQQLSYLENQYNYEKQYISEKYKQKYEREQAEILRMKKATATNVPKQEQLMKEQKDLDLVKKQMELEQQKLQLEKQKLELELQIELLKKQKEALNQIKLSPDKKGFKP